MEIELFQYIVWENLFSIQWVNSSSTKQNCSRLHSNFFLYYFSEKVRLGISCELSATVFSTSLGKTLFAWHFILDENILF